MVISWVWGSGAGWLGIEKRPGERGGGGWKIEGVC